jgi:hypothetical protein
MARPRINDSDKRVVQVNIRLTKEEIKKVNQYASTSGMSPANWIRYKVFVGKFPPVKLSPIDTALYQELKRIGVNLNQVTHKINQGDFPKEYLMRQLELTALLNRILKTLIDDRQPDKGKRV